MVDSTVPPAKRKKKPPAITCGAKNRQGGACGKRPMRGRERCRNHGGVTTTKGNKSAAKPGALYSQFLTEEEQNKFHTIELGTVDAEIRLLRIRLERALREEQQNAIELEEFVFRGDGGPNTVTEEHKYKKRDWRALVDRLTSRIESLEKTRAELLRTPPDDPEEPASVSFTFEVVDGRKSA